MRRRLAVAVLLLACITMTSMIVTGCAYRRDDRSLVQPLAVSKKQFTGEWYYMKTVYEASYESGYWAGQGSWPLGAKIRFEITERFLYAFNVVPNVRDTGSALTPIASWPISRHFDIKARLNYSTGEPSNVIVEESMDGAPWYQRKYMRVHWERSTIPDLMNIGETYRMWVSPMFREEPVNYVPPQKMEMNPNYIGYVVDRYVTNAYRAWFLFRVLEVPVNSNRVRVRHSFKKVEPSTYEPVEYNDFMMSKFGNFRKTIVRYHPDRGLVDWSYKFYAARHNIATQEEINKGTKKPLKVTYYLSPNFPKDLEEVAKTVATDWNSAMAFALGRKAKDSNGKNAVFEILPNAHGLKEGQTREIGDLRHNVLWWVNERVSSPLGYGPSFADPETGEIKFGAAYVYGAGFRLQVESYMTLYDLLTGRYDNKDLINGFEYFNAAFGLNGHKHLLATPSTTKMSYTPKASHLGRFAPTFRLANTQKLLNRIHSPEFFTRMEKLQLLDRTTINSQIAKLENNPKAKSTVASDFIAHLAYPFNDPTETLNSTDPFVKGQVDKYHPLSLIKPQNFRKYVEEYMAPSRRTMYMAEYTDPALDAFVQYHARKKTPRDELRKKILVFMLAFVTAHEVGHTLGLMHNFSGSSDEHNYHSAYYDIKEGKTPTKCGVSDLPCRPDQVDVSVKAVDPLTGKLTNEPAILKWYRNAAVMDYPGEMYDASLGVGKSDRAALTFMYGQKVEKAVDDPRKVGELIPWSMDVEKKHQDPTNSLKIRNYRYCGDYSQRQDPFCQVWDSGPSATGIVQQIILNYDRRYPLIYFRRGRRGFNANWAIGANFLRFAHIATFYQDWAYRVTTQPNYEKTADFKDKLAAIQMGYGFFMRVLATPRVGVHRKDKNDGMWKTRGIVDEDRTAATFDIKLGEGRAFFPSIQLENKYFGLFRYGQIGSLYDKYITMMISSMRSFGYYNNNINWLYTNFYDLFKEDTLDFYSQGFANVWNPDSPILFKACEMDKNKECKKDGNNNVIKRPLQPAWHPFLQFLGMQYGLILLNNPYHDRTFSNYMMVGLKGSGKSWTPPGMGQVTCPPLNNFTGQFQCGDEKSQIVCFNNFHGTRTYFAPQTNDKYSISTKLVHRGCELSNQLALLRKNGGASRAFVERKESELELIETTLTIMQLYTSIFQG